VVTIAKISQIALGIAPSIQIHFVNCCHGMSKFICTTVLCVRAPPPWGSARERFVQAAPYAHHPQKFLELRKVPAVKKIWPGGFSIHTSSICETGVTTALCMIWAPH
jgi:hypothetical protein